MLIASDRHRPEDLALWEELEYADLTHGERLVRLGRVGKTSQVVRDFTAAGACYASVSWGKDSVVLAHLIRLCAPAVPLVHLRVTPSHSPHCDDVRDAFLAAFPGPYHELPVDYGDVYARGLADDEQDRGTDRLWAAGFAEANRLFGDRYLSGVRADESGGRRIRLRKWGETGPRSCLPLGWWTVADVFGYLAHWRLPVHPNYAMLGGGRWPRDRIRVAEVGDVHGNQFGRREWEQEFYGDVLRRLAAAKGTS